LLLQATTKVLLASFSSLTALGSIVLRHTLDPCYAGFGLVWTPNVFFIGEFWQKFNLKNVTSINAKGFFMGKIVQICQISKKNKILIARFLQQVPVGSQEYRRILVFFYFHIWHVARIG
jgi:hypothetical protein